MLSLVTVLEGNGREIPLRITAPEAHVPHPVVLFSHGHRYSHDHYLPLARHWVAAGFAVLQPGHEDASSRDFAYGGPGRPDELWRWRIEDLQTVLAGLEGLQRRYGELNGRFDVARIAAVGHSFGAHTVQMLAGARVRGEASDFRDPAVKAVVLIAGPGAGADLSEAWAGRRYLDVDWSGLDTPALVIAGDADRPWPMSDRDWDWRLDPYRQAPSGGRHALVVADAGHFFGGIQQDGNATQAETLQRDLVCDAATAFLRSVLGSRNSGWSEACARFAAAAPPLRCFVSK